MPAKTDTGSRAKLRLSEKILRWRYCLLVEFLGIYVTALCCCNLFVGDTAQIKTSFTVDEDTSRYSVESMTGGIQNRVSVASLCDLAGSERISFTPTSLKIRVKYLSIVPSRQRPT